MISSVKKAIADKLAELYPTSRIYDEDIPQKFKTPSFRVTLIEQGYSKRLNTKYRSELLFDVAYLSDKSVAEIKTDCQTVQLNLLRSFDLVSNYRVLNKMASITDNVLHFTFNINYSEMVVETNVEMLTQTTNTNI